MKEAIKETNDTWFVLSDQSHRLTPEEGQILLQASEGPAREINPQMLAAIENYKRMVTKRTR